MRFLVVAAIMVVAVFAAYSGVRNNGFVQYDDPMFVTDNAHVQAGLTWEGLQWAFGSFDTGLWHPLTWLSHMLDVELYGMQPAGHHLTNVGLHAANALLLLVALMLLTGSGGFWPSAAVALLWALHPLRVESVAWAAERKDLLCAFFGLLCLALYAWHARRPSSMRFALVALALTLGLMAKPMLVTWPFLLLLLDFWPLRRPPSMRGEPIKYDTTMTPVARLAVEKLPLLMLGVPTAIVAIIAEKTQGTVTASEHLPLPARFANAAIAIVRYLGKTFWPADLAVLYPHPSRWPLWMALASLALILAITLLAFAARRRSPWLIVGWLWFVGTLLPVIGIVQIGAQSMADRYTYLPQIGVLIAIGFTLWALLHEHLTRMILLVLAAACGLFVQTQHHVQFWRDSRTLFEHAIAVTTDNWVMHNNLGAMALDRNELARAATHFREAVRIAPNNAGLHGSLGEALARQGQTAESISRFERAIELDPHYHGAMNNLAWLLATMPPPLRDGPRAALLAENVCAEADPSAMDYASFLDTLGAAYAAVGRFQDALDAASRALDLSIQRQQADLTPQIVAHMRLYEQRRTAE